MHCRIYLLLSMVESFALAEKTEKTAAEGSCWAQPPSIHRLIVDRCKGYSMDATSGSAQWRLLELSDLASEVDH
ncbi:hypothetical protein BDW67DRAFT_155858 [Aspergillus spinulosporus]